MKDPAKSLSLIVVGLGCLYFAWLFSATGIFVAGRSHVAVTAADDPDRFGVAVTALIGAASLVGGLVMSWRR
jgi:hypothetical protein